MLSARIEAIFDRSPGLCGFSIDERLVSGSAREGPREWELYVSAVQTLPELGDRTKRFIGEISGARSRTGCQQQPEARPDLLPGRTFARVWHCSPSGALAPSAQGELRTQVVPEVLPARPAHRPGAGVELGPVRKRAAFGQRRVHHLEKPRRNLDGRPAARARCRHVRSVTRALPWREAFRSHGSRKTQARGASQEPNARPTPRDNAKRFARL